MKKSFWEMGEYSQTESSPAPGSEFSVLREDGFPFHRKHSRYPQPEPAVSRDFQGNPSHLHSPFSCESTDPSTPLSITEEQSSRNSFHQSLTHLPAPPGTLPAAHGLLLGTLPFASLHLQGESPQQGGGGRFINTPTGNQHQNQ